MSKSVVLLFYVVCSNCESISRHCYRKVFKTLGFCMFMTCKIILCCFVLCLLLQGTCQSCGAGGPNLWACLQVGWIEFYNLKLNGTLVCAYER